MNVPHTPTDGVSLQSTSGGRAPDHIRAAAKIAGIPPNSSRPIQLLQFSPNLINDDQVKLLQLNKETRDALKAGDRLVIKGQEDDDAVLCTKDSTYDLRICETSNSLLLCPKLTFPADCVSEDNSIVNREVIGRVSNILEMKKCRPKVERLKEILSDDLYRGPLAEAEMEGTQPIHRERYTFDDLLLLVQASEVELMEELRVQQACLINGYWRLLDAEYRDEVVQQILTLLVEQDWAWQCVPLERCCDLLSELQPSFIIKHCLECYGKSHDQEGMGVVYELDEDKICRYYAEVLLRPAGKFNYDEFLEVWQESVPAGMKTSLEQLKGLALSDKKTTPPVVWHFPVGYLPNDPSARFAKLFEVREKWTYEDLEPYIKGLITSTTPLNTLLLKYTRVSTSSTGVKLYNSKANPV